MNVASAPVKQTATLAPASGLKNEEAIIEKIRTHLRECNRNKAIGVLTFKLEFVRGGVKEARVGMQVNYDFLEGFGPQAS